MTTWTAIAIQSDRSIAQALADALETLDPAPIGIACLEVEDGSGRFEAAGYFDEKPDEIALMLIAAACNGAPFVVSKLDPTDWVAQVRRELTPVRAGRFVVHGRHDRDQLGGADISLEIEAAMAFGTGHHGTTLGCLELTNWLGANGVYPRKLADIGTGTGILAMAAARKWPKARIMASDIEDISVETARANFRANRISSAHVFRATGFQHPRYHQSAPFDLIYANILARPLRRLAKDMYAHTAEQGYIVLSGILNWQAHGVRSQYESVGFRMIKTHVIGEWVSFIFRKT